MWLTDSSVGKIWLVHGYTWHLFQVSEKSADKKKHSDKYRSCEITKTEYDKLILYPFDSPLIVKTQRRKMNLFSDHIPKQSIWSRLLLLSAEWPVKSGALLKCITCMTSDKILHNPWWLVVTLLKHNAVHNRHCKIRKSTGNWHVIHYTSSIFASADFYWGPFMGHSHIGVTWEWLRSHTGCGMCWSTDSHQWKCELLWYCTGEHAWAVVAVANSGFVEQTQPHLLRYPRMVGWISRGVFHFSNIFFVILLVLMCSL